MGEDSIMISIITENNYVVSYWYTSKGKYEDSILDGVDLNYLNCYKLMDNSLLLDEEKYLLEKQRKEEEEAIRKREEQINELKMFLNDTDYIVAETFEKVMVLDNPVTFISDFIKIMVQFNSKYADLIANRKIWRDRIEELSK